MEIKATLPWRVLGKQEGRLPRWPNGRKRRQAEPSGRCGQQCFVSVVPTFGKIRGPMPTFKSVVILDLPKKVT